MLNIILADDEPMITQGIQTLLSRAQLGVQVIATYEDGQQALHGILTQEPAIAVLDIAMPGKTGIDILKELRAAECPTKIIFLSGYQDFGYAQAALRYGAVDYLLKPVKKDSLFRAIGKCMRMPGLQGASQPSALQDTIPPAAYRQLVHDEQVCYILTAVHFPGLEGKSGIEKQLALFSAFDRIEEAMEQGGLGIAFQREGKTYLVFKGADRLTARAFLLRLQEDISACCGCASGFIMGPTVQELQLLKACAAQCEALSGYFYFYDRLEGPILETGLPVFSATLADDALHCIQSDLLKALFQQDTKMQLYAESYLQAVCITAKGRRDTAVYYLLSCLRAVEERLEGLDIEITGPKVSALVKALEDTSSYNRLEKLFIRQLAQYQSILSENMQKHEKRDIIFAKRYIEEHYAENISLETMAKQIHMNPFYFSSYFKKQTGHNFKDYLNRVRMGHALDLLLTTQKKSYEIAEDVGFKDYRYFSELFSRHYGKTPTAYRKQMLENQGAKAPTGD